MKNKLKIITLFVSTLLTINISVANADPTYAVLDANGNVTNIIVCGSACASGELDGNKVVLQVAPDPVTGENRGGFWNGPGSTTYDHSSGVFTMIANKEVSNSVSENENEETTTSLAIINGDEITQFKYSDTVGSNLFTRAGFIYEWTENSSATISVNKNNIIESLDFSNRKTTNEIEESIAKSGLILLNSKIQTLIFLLGSWVK